MRKTFWVAGLMALSFFTTTAHAETRADRLSLANDYINATLQDIDMVQVIQGMWKPLAAQAEAGGAPLSPAQLQQIDALYQEQFTEPMTQIMRDQAEVMADVYTLAEITALSDFYQTEHGRSAMVKLPKLIEYQTPMIVKMVQQQMPAMMPKIRQIIEGR